MRDEFINLLLCQELLTKRIDSLDNLHEGLNYFGLVDLLGKVPHIGKQMFRDQEETDVTANALQGCTL